MAVQRPHTLLSDEALGCLRDSGSEVEYGQGATIVRRGEVGRAFYVLLEGRAEVRVPAGGDNGHLPIARLGPGSSFGEMALLRHAPVSADVVAVDPVRVLEVPAERFEAALSDCSALRTELLRRMAENINNTNADALGLFLRAATLDKLIRRDWASSPVIAESVRMKQALRKIEEAAAHADPVLITGAAGTGKTFAARLLHERGDEGAPFFVVDCRSLEPDEAPRFVMGSASGRVGRVGEGQVGALHVAHQGTLVLRHVDRLPRELQGNLADYIRTIARDADALLPRVRIVATMEAQDKRTELAGILDEGLAALLEGQVITMPTLLQRRFDILPLARLFLEEARGDRALHLTHEAEDALLSCGYGHRNVAELREAVEVATVFTDGDEIRREHIFTGPRSEQSLPEADLGKAALIRGLWSRRWVLPSLRGGALAGFSAVILLCVLAGETVAGKLANGAIWALWEPVVIVLFLFLGHVWCTVCPLSTAGTLVQKVFSLRRPPPAWAKRYGGWLMLAGFFLIVWSERIFHMTSFPLASGLLLGSLMVASVACCAVYQREVWCRYLCPLGALASGYSTASTLHVRANPSVCASRCTSHECYKGSDGSPGCPVYHHPLYANDSHLCKLCLGCLERCPHQSARLYLRPPLLAVWRIGYSDATLVPFAVAVFLLGLVLQASQLASWTSRPQAVTLLGLAAVGFGVLLSVRLPRLVEQEPEAASPVVTSVAFSLLVLGWGPLMAYQLGNIPALRWVFLAGHPGTAIADWLGQLSLLPVLQLLSIALASGLAAVALWRIAARAREQSVALNRAGWAALSMLVVVYVIAAVALVVMS